MTCTGSHRTLLTDMKLDELRELFVLFSVYSVDVLCYYYMQCTVDIVSHICYILATVMT